MAPCLARVDATARCGILLRTIATSRLAGLHRPNWASVAQLPPIHKSGRSVGQCPNHRSEPIASQVGRNAAAVSSQ